MLHPERSDCNPSKAEIGARAKAKNRLHQKNMNRAQSLTVRCFTPKALIVCSPYLLLQARPVGDFGTFRKSIFAND